MSEEEKVEGVEEFDTKEDGVETVEGAVSDEVKTAEPETAEAGA